MTTVKEALDRYVAETNKKFDREERSKTCGASEIFGCARKLWYDKHGIAEDEDYRDDWGARVRGNLIEDHFMAPAFARHLPKGFEAIRTGHNQKTVADGVLSATPDGVVANVTNEPLVFEGQTVAPHECFLTEFKSIDPRANIDQPKPQHVGQVVVQMGLVREMTMFKPAFALLIYVDASFLDKLTVFNVSWEHNREVFDQAHARARAVFDAPGPNCLKPEGKIAGAQECQYCPWAAQCLGERIAAIPNGSPKLTSEQEQSLLQQVEIEREAYEAKCEWSSIHSEAVETLKKMLQDVGTRRAYDSAGKWSVTWSHVGGRKTISKKLIEDAGLDPEDFVSEGSPSETLTVKLKRETK